MKRDKSKDKCNVCGALIGETRIRGWKLCNACSTDRYILYEAQAKLNKLLYTQPDAAMRLLYTMLYETGMIEMKELETVLKVFNGR
jgi:hypothetical protein